MKISFLKYPKFQLGRAMIDVTTELQKMRSYPAFAQLAVNAEGTFNSIYDQVLRDDLDANEKKKVTKVLNELENTKGLPRNIWASLRSIRVSL